MQEILFEKLLDGLASKDRRYDREAYCFIRQALEITQLAVAQATRSLRHVTGKELLHGIRELALGQFGPMAKAVFEQWGIHSCRDFGEIFFNMVDAGFLARSADDVRADFEHGFDFDDAFSTPFLPPSKQVASA